MSAVAWRRFLYDQVARYCCGRRRGGGGGGNRAARDRWHGSGCSAGCVAPGSGYAVLDGYKFFDGGHQLTVRALSARPDQLARWPIHAPPEKLGC